MIYTRWLNLIFLVNELSQTCQFHQVATNYVKIRLVATCHLQNCKNLLKQLVASFDNQLATSQLTTCNRLVVNMRTHPDIGLLITRLLQDVNTLVATGAFWLCKTYVSKQRSKLPLIPERRFVSVAKDKHSSSPRTFEQEFFPQTIQRSSYQHTTEGICTSVVRTCPCPRPLHISCVCVRHSLEKTTFLQVPPAPDAVLPVVVSVFEVY